MTKRTPKKVANLTRFEYGASRGIVNSRPGPFRSREDLGEPFDVEIDAPIQASVTMQPSYAAMLLKQLHNASPVSGGDCVEIVVDCPVAIVLDASTLERLKAVLREACGGDIERVA
jgi:hypothetical protein